PNYTNLEAAYQLHFYLCFKTRRLQPVLAKQGVSDLLRGVVADVCDRQQYHVLDLAVSSDHLRLLISLKPEHAVSQVVKMLKGNIARAMGRRLPKADSGLARGYFARSSGRVDLDTVKGYVSKQVSHHGYRGDWTKALEYMNPGFISPAFQHSHSVSLLSYHLVLVTRGRVAVFDDTIAPRLFKYIVAIGQKRGFAVERMSLLPDHIHLVFEAKPDITITELALALTNNTAHWMGKHYW